MSTPALVRDGVLAPYREFGVVRDPHRRRTRLPGPVGDALAGSDRGGDGTRVRAAGPAGLPRLRMGGARRASPGRISNAPDRNWRGRCCEPPTRAGGPARTARACVTSTGSPCRSTTGWRSSPTTRARSWPARTHLGPAWQQLRAAMSSVGWTLTRNGARRGQSPVDRVLARSAAKAMAAGLPRAAGVPRARRRSAGHRADRLRERRRHGTGDLQQILTRHAGTAWEALRQVQAGQPGVALVLMTGSSVGGDPDVLAGLLPRD